MSVDWMNVAQGKGYWQTLINNVMDFHVPKQAGNFIKS
jgi:hypothetical protein